MFATAVYQHSPVWLQESLISARGRIRRALREGRRFRRLLAEIRRSEWYSEEALAALQLERVRNVVAHAARHVPYYAQLLSDAGMEPEDLRSLDDLRRLPMLDKRAVVAAGDRIVARDATGPRLGLHTSGSTGAPLRILQTIDAATAENAFTWRQLAWAGYAAHEPRAWLRGDMVVPYAQSRTPYWRYNRAEHMLMMSSYHLGAETAAEYVAALERFDPVLIQAYPSSIRYLAGYLEARGGYYRGRRLRAVVTSSETLTDEDRRLIAQRLGAAVFDHYGSAERVALIQTCERGRYHLASDYAYTELIPAGEGTYEIVGTGFYNPLMPLIRYRMEDTVELDPHEDACACGRAFPLVRRILGRMDDYVKTPDGRRIGRLDHVFKGIRGIAASQIVQDRIDALTIRLVPLAGFDETERRRLLAQVHERVGTGMTVRLEPVAEIARTRNGKLRAVVCNV